MRNNNFGSGNFFHDAFENIRLNKLLSSATVFIFVACFIVTSSFGMLIANINSLVNEIIDRNEIVAFINDDNSDDENANIRKIIETNVAVGSYTFVSADQALKEYSESLGAEYGWIYDEFKDDNFLRASYHIVLTDIAFTDDVALLLRNTAGVGEVHTQQIQVSEFVNIRNIISLLSVWLIVILVVVSIFIIFNTVKMTLFARKTEINIMKYVGATDTFIRIPYIIEGVLLGVIASVISFFLEWMIYDCFLFDGLSKLGFFTPLPFSDFAPLLIICYIVAAVAFGVFGSVLPMRKYLRV